MLEEVCASASVCCSFLLVLAAASLLVFNNSFGGTRSNSAVGIARDTQGNIYVAGQTNSANFPVQNALQNHPGAAPLLASSDGGQTFSPSALGAAISVTWIVAAAGVPSVLYAAGGPWSCCSRSLRTDGFATGGVVDQDHD
ncbi:MAG: hypothetical protein DMG59_27780 [Acidobacteria bacterium]|nr:MAG: hypothetical protein DMG59_27780 [Acidobacteriota bacterium]